MILPEMYELVDALVSQPINPDEIYDELLKLAKEKKCKHVFP